MGLLIDRINNKLEKRNLIREFNNEHALNREPVPLNSTKPNSIRIGQFEKYNKAAKKGVSRIMKVPT